MPMVVKVLTSGTSFTVPSGVKKIGFIACQGSGGKGGSSNGSSGGGGGAYASITDLVVSPGQVISYQIGAGGGTDTTWFRSTSTVLADYGRNGSGTSNTTTSGGLASNSVGTVKYSGGTGGSWASWGAGAGGGGAAGPDGIGKNGGNVSSPAAGGGGGADGLSSTDALSNGYGGTGPTGVSSPYDNSRASTDGAGGSGGSAGGSGYYSGSAGGNYLIWSDTSTNVSYGPGGGGGGGYYSGYTGGAGGYGGGGGGGGGGYAGGAGGSGYIVLAYDDGQPTSIVVTKLLLPGTTSFTVPAKCTSLDFVGCQGPGGNGFKSDVNGGNNRNGGGGGAWASKSNIAVTPGQVIPVSIPSGGSQSTTTFNTSTIVADYGRNATISSIGTGGTAAASTGTTKYTGGNGGQGGDSNGGNGGTGGGGGGGGAATDSGNGQPGGRGTDYTGDGGAGGGGAGGPSATAGFGFSPGESGYHGSSGGTGPTGTTNNGGIGYNGAGGGGGYPGYGGSDAAPYTLYSTNVGSCGGGGGTAASAGSQYKGGNSAYGGGGGGGSAQASGGSQGGAGFIIVRYTLSIFLVTEILPVGTTSWTVPAGVTSLFMVGCQGAGGSSIYDPNSTMSSGGGGGAWASKSDVAVTPGQTISISVAGGGSRSFGAAATYSSFGSGPLVRAASGQSSPGTNNYNDTPGGLASECIGDTLSDGGVGRYGYPDYYYYDNDSGSESYQYYPGSGGGGAGGPNGPGGNGGRNGYGVSVSNNQVQQYDGQGGGGGGANGGSSGTDGRLTQNQGFGDGGNNRFGTGKGLAFCNYNSPAQFPTSGTNGGGGGGGYRAYVPGSGSAEKLFGNTRTGLYYGPGGGGGGSGSRFNSGPTTGGKPGPGGGAGGDHTGTNKGGDGYVVIQYVANNSRRPRTSSVF